MVHWVTKSTELYPELSANAALTLLVVACALLDRQVSRLADGCVGAIPDCVHSP